MPASTISRGHAVASLAALAATASARPLRAQTLPRIRLGAVASETYAEPLYAAGSGAFTRAGLDVEIAMFPSGAGLNEAVRGGALDVGSCDPIELMNAREHGIPYAYFAGGLISNADASTTLLCTAADGPVHGAHDLEGAPIAIITLHSLAEFSIREWMTQQGADASKARFVELPGPAMGPAVARGTVAAAMLIEPFLSLAGADARVLANPYRTVANRFILNAYYAPQPWLAANVDVVRRLAAAFAETARWAAAHHPESGAILAAAAKLAPERIAAMRRASYATALAPQLLAPVIAIAAKYHAVEKAVPAADLIFAA
jgi:NitT/TauT family transport system substrate-binding protein